MTHQTEAERADFEVVASDYGECPKAIERDAKGNYLLMHTATGWMWWQAARRAPAAPVPQSIEQMAVDRYKVVPSHSSMFYPCAVVAGDGQQQLYIGREAECQNMARKFTGAFLDGAFVALAAAPQPPEAAPHALQTERGLIGENPASKPVAQGSVSNATLAAPVELPEPEWWINYCAFTSKETASRIQESELASAPLYTEQQVRKLLDTNGVKANK